MEERKDRIRRLDGWAEPPKEERQTFMGFRLEKEILTWIRGKVERDVVGEEARDLNTKTLRLRHSFKISAIDAAQPFDYESRLSDHIAKSKTLKTAIVGFGNFSQFLAKTLAVKGTQSLHTPVPITSQSQPISASLSTLTPMTSAQNTLR
ncbi:hypothetical protein L2E82_19976 [Cichorium intybus]|uniref:Uncharacterized protein n=1 Tax=Cichorium intybus TaxID=13427 RepID=A0ACB9DT23_CICIN|nr:hypothetical protein L2E82_19976 [Cichorium intybus]